MICLMNGVGVTDVGSQQVGDNNKLARYFRRPAEFDFYFQIIYLSKLFANIVAYTFQNSN